MSQANNETDFQPLYPSGQELQGVTTSDLPVLGYNLPKKEDLDILFHNTTRISSNIYTYKPDELKKKLIQIKDDGVSHNKLHMVVDFDHTLTHPLSQTSWTVFDSNDRDFSTTFLQNCLDLARYYYNIDFDPSIPYDVKQQHQTDWFIKFHSLLINSQLSEDLIDKIIAWFMCDIYNIKHRYTTNIQRYNYDNDLAMFIDPNRSGADPLPSWAAMKVSPSSSNDTSSSSSNADKIHQTSNAHNISSSVPPQDTTVPAAKKTTSSCPTVSSQRASFAPGIGDTGLTRGMSTTPVSSSSSSCPTPHHHHYSGRQWSPCHGTNSDGVTIDAIRFRDGFYEWLDTLYTAKVPLLIITAGITNVLSSILKHENIHHNTVTPQYNTIDNTLSHHIYLFGNTMVKRDSEKQQEQQQQQIYDAMTPGNPITTYTKGTAPLLTRIHHQLIIDGDEETKRSSSLSKSEVDSSSITEPWCNAIVMGDALGDRHIATSLKYARTILKVGYLNLAPHINYTLLLQVKIRPHDHNTLCPQYIQRTNKHNSIHETNNTTTNSNMNGNTDNNTNNNSTNTTTTTIDIVNTVLSGDNDNDDDERPSLGQISIDSLLATPHDTDNNGQGEDDDQDPNQSVSVSSPQQQNTSRPSSAAVSVSSTSSATASTLQLILSDDNHTHKCQACYILQMQNRIHTYLTHFDLVCFSADDMSIANSILRYVSHQ